MLTCYADLSGGFGHLHRAAGDPNTLACFCERAERPLSASRALKNGVCDTLSHVVRFAAGRLCTNPIERNLHIGQRAAIEVFVNHIDPPEILRCFQPAPFSTLQNQVSHPPLASQ
jgi:hypothetical protein